MQIARELEVVCPACGGRAAIDAELRAYPQWTCPFCREINQTPSETEDAPRGRRGYRAGAPLIAGAVAVALGVVAVLSVAFQSRRADPPHRTVEGLLAALSTRGLTCDGAVVFADPTAPARESATCEMNGSRVTIVTFFDRFRRASYDLGPGLAVVADTWVIVTHDRSLARRLARSTGARMTDP